MTFITRPALAMTTAISLLLAAPLVGQVETPKIPDDKDPKKTTSGLEYSVLKAGEGASPKLGDKVKVHYTGWLTDGTMFDSSRQRGTPAEFALGLVIPGWNEGLQLMSPGARYKLTIPSDLAYGDAGRPPTIPGKSTLVFDVELISFSPGRKPMPEFGKPGGIGKKTSDSGLVYEIVAAGEGEPPADSDAVTFEMAYWNSEGKLMYSSTWQDQSPSGPVNGFRLPVITECLKLLKPGGRIRCIAPPELAFKDQAQPGLPAGATTVWVFEELVDILRVPDFVLPPQDKLTKTESGLQYEVVKAGEGESPKMGEPVTVHYAGWLTDGTLFDSSYKRGQPATFQLGRVIEGWNEGLQLMKPGAVYRLVIPGDLAYGASGRPPTIPANATLVFYVKLLK